MKKLQNSMLIVLFFSALVLQAEEAKEQSSIDDIKLKGRLSAISGFGVDYILRAEGWVKIKIRL